MTQEINVLVVETGNADDGSSVGRERRRDADIASFV